MSTSWRAPLLTVTALIGFAANSLLTRGALATGRLDAASFTAVRLLSGAVALGVITHLRPPARAAGLAQGSWISAVALAGYAITFTIAYRRIGAGVGALALFGAVQVTMIGKGLVDGERPTWCDAGGLLLALVGLLTLTMPGASAPDPIGLLLMAVAGACWGAYSLRGRRSLDPIGATAGNFLRASIAGVVFALVARSTLTVSAAGLGLAVASGALASGVGYALWYAALPSLSAWRAAVVQLAVPVLTAGAAVVLLHEPVSWRLAMAAGLIASGVLLTVWPGRVAGQRVGGAR